MAKYIRTEIKNFYELSEAQQTYARAQFDWDENIEESNFVECPNHENEVLHLGECIRMDRSRLWSGYWGMSYFSAYFLKVGSDGTTCTVGYRYW